MNPPHVVFPLLVRVLSQVTPLGSLYHTYIPTLVCISTHINPLKNLLPTPGMSPLPIDGRPPFVLVSHIYPLTRLTFFPPSATTMAAAADGALGVASVERRR